MSITPEQEQKFKFRARLEEEQAASAAPPTPTAPQYDKGGEPWYQDFGEGVGVSGIKTYQGVKDLLGLTPLSDGVTDEERAVLADWKADAGQSGWGTGGEIVGDIAQIVGTGGLGGASVKGGLTLAAKAAAKKAAGKGAARSLARGLMQARKMKAPILKDVLASGAVGAVQAPEEGKTRTDNAVGDAASALAGGVAAKVLGKAVRGIRKTPEAQKLLDAGVRLTPGMASQRSGIQGLENLMQVLPSLSIGRQTAREGATDSMVKLMMEKAAPKGVKVTGTVRDRAHMLKDGFTKGYSRAWSKAEKPSVPQIMKMQNVLKETGSYIGEDGKGALRKISKDLKNLSGGFSAKAVQNLDHTLKKQIRRAARAGDVNLEEGLNSVRLTLRTSLPDTARAEIKALDDQYGKYLVAKKAVVKAKSEGGNATPEQLMQSVGMVGGETRTFVGQAPLQEFAADVMATVGRKEPTILQDIQKGLVAKVPTHQPTMDALGRMTLGETAPQKALGNAINSPVADALRKLGVRGGILNVAHDKTGE